jgi:hypothetical protein
MVVYANPASADAKAVSLFGTGAGVKGTIETWELKQANNVHHTGTPSGPLCLSLGGFSCHIFTKNRCILDRLFPEKSGLLL